MPEGDGAPVHVHALRIGAEHRSRIHDDGREGLVQLDTLDVVDRLTGLLERDLARLGGGAREVGEIVGHVSLRDDGREHLEAPLLRVLLARDDESPGPVVHPGRVPGGGRPLGVEDGLEAGELLVGRVPARALVDGDAVHRNKLVLEEPVLDGVDGALVRAKGPPVLILARDAQLPGDKRRLLDHVLLIEGGGESVMGHQVDQGAVPEPVAEPRLLEDVGSIRHRLHPTRDHDAVVTRANHEIGDLDRADAGGADLVDRVGGDLLRQAGAKGRLPGGRLPGAALEHLTHDDVLDLVVRNACAVESRADGDRAEPGCLVVLQGAAELAKRRTDGGCDH
jgi:hypothetical protein